MRTNVPGAEFHDFGQCKRTNILVPSLFAFWKHANPEMKEFVLGNLGVDAGEWRTVESYLAWLLCKRADTLNYLYVYWWVLVHSGRL